MKCEFRTMLTSTLAQLLLFSLTAGLYHAAPRASNNNELSDSGQPAVSEIPLELNSTTMPNYLPEDKVRFSTNSQLSQVLTATTAETWIPSKTTQSFQTNKLTGDGRTIISDPMTKDMSLKSKDSTPPITPNTSTGIVQTTTSLITSTVLTSRATETKTNSSLSFQTPPVPTTDRQSTELPCNCSGEGSVDAGDCDTGRCVCLSGYAGLRCDECQDGHFDNGTTGCVPCGCDSSGADGPRCDSFGVCVCKTGVYGDKCDECRPGFYRFSDAGCQPCQCNNHSSSCHPQSGVCLNCQGNAKGPACEECKYNFYRRPGAALGEACVPCPCSSVTSSGSCHIDPGGLSVCDQCKPGYQGPHCDQCRDGFYNADSICLPCNCSGNADPRTSPRVCNPETGHCASCVNHTAGKHCERCAEGHVGTAVEGCRAIVTVPPEQTPPPSSIGPTMSSTAPLTTASSSTQSLLANATADISQVSWSQFHIIVLAVIIVALAVLMAAAGGVYSYREYYNRKLNAPFWTIELKEDNISFSSYHDSLPNMGDVSGLLEEEAGMEAAPTGQLALSSPINMYKA